MDTYNFYHGTSLENWNKIKQEGVLWGRRYVTFNDKVKELSRCTYLAVNKEEAKQYGEILLEVNYNPYDDEENNNYTKDCWQIRVYSPISLDKVKRIQ